MSLSREEREAILRAAAERTKKEFASEVAVRTKLTNTEVMALGRTAAEREALARVVGAVSSARVSNTKKAQTIRDISGGVEALVKLAGLVL